MCLSVCLSVCRHEESGERAASCGDRGSAEETQSVEKDTHRGGGSVQVNTTVSVCVYSVASKPCRYTR